MESFPTEKEEPFNSYDIAILESRRKNLRTTAIAGCIILPAIAVAAIQFIVESENKIQIQISTAIALIVFTLVLSWRDIKRLEGHIKNGMKTIVRGEITRQRYSGGNKESRIYYLYMDQLKIRVPPGVYEQYKIGDKVEFHIYKPLYNLLLHVEKI